jgi:hypothetical protein
MPSASQTHHYDIHVFCCINERAPGHPRGSCSARGSQALQAYHRRPKFTALQAAALIDPDPAAQTKRLTLSLHVGLQSLRTTGAAGSSRVTRGAFVDTAEHVDIVVMRLTG